MQNGNRVRVRVRVRGLGLESWLVAWVRVRFRVVFCHSIVQFLTILHILHCTDANRYGSKNRA